MTSVINAPSVKKAFQVTDTRPPSPMKPSRAKIKVSKAFPGIKIIATKSPRKRGQGLYYLSR
jgi:hypothetical protein